MNWHIVTTLCQWSGILWILLDPCGLHVIIAIVLKISFNIHLRYIYHETDLHIAGVITIGGPFVCFLSNSQMHTTGAQLVICSRAIIQKFANPQIPRNLAKLPVAIWITAMITSLPGSHTLPCRSVPKRLGINVFEMYFPVKYNQRKQQEINCLWHWQHILHWNWIKWINGIKWQQGREATKLWHLQLCMIIVTH